MSRMWSLQVPGKFENEALQNCPHVCSRNKLVSGSLLVLTGMRVLCSDGTDTHYFRCSSVQTFQLMGRIRRSNDVLTEDCSYSSIPQTLVNISFVYYAFSHQHLIVGILLIFITLMACAWNFKNHKK
jgi:membrane-associated HD superfamily phosphohydrolase